MTNIEGSSLKVGDDLSAAGSTINGMAMDIEDDLNSLLVALGPVAASWTGAASANYEALQQEWNQAANGLFGPDGVLGEIAATMNINWNNYAEAEQANIKTWQT
jgi:WXG100 family type VII secretion target